MSDHLSPTMLSALADGELSAEQLVQASEHLTGCPVCTSDALSLGLLKSATARAGRRYAPPAELRARLQKLVAQEDAAAPPTAIGVSPISIPKSSMPISSVPTSVPIPMPIARRSPQFGRMGWALAAALLLAAVCIGVVQRSLQQSQASSGRAALITEVCDQHIAVLAAGLPPQVLSSDRHTVKPWFQGKLPFSFNLPEKLPADTTLDGANLTYLHNQPVAQLLYNIGRHRVSVFLLANPGATAAHDLFAEHSGFHLRTFTTSGLEAVAVSDADSARLSELVNALEQAQTR